LIHCLICAAIVDSNQCNERNSEPAAGQQIIIQCWSKWSSACCFTG